MIKFTFYGHACCLLELGGSKMLFDPFISGNPQAAKIDLQKIAADYIFISHGHGDHTSDVVDLARQTGALCVASFEITNWLQANGIDKVHPMNHGGPISFEFGKVRGVNAIHSSSFADGSYAGNPMGFLFTTAEGNFYYSGDTALTMDMQLIPHWCSLDFAILPIGGNFTMDTADALEACRFIHCNTAVGIHYNTFPPIQIDTAKAIEYFKKAGKKLLLPAIGETIELNGK